MEQMHMYFKPARKSQNDFKDLFKALLLTATLFIF